MALSFRVLDAEQPADYADWEAHWQCWPQREVFAHPAYSLLYKTAGIRCCCAVLATERGNVLYSFHLRDLSDEAYCPMELKPLYDLSSPYGYAGPFCWEAADPAALAAEFWLQFNAWALRQPVVSEVVRFHLASESLLPYPGEREELFKNVVCDLTRSEEDIWMGFEHKVRKNVKKAQRSNVSVVVDFTGKHLDDFLRIYYDTMKRREAGDSFYFQREYFQQLAASLSGQWAYFHSLHEGRVISTELVLISVEAIYSFLGGTDETAFHLRPNDLLKFEIIRWGKQNGKKRFVLGGGYGAEDGIFRYKQSFAPQGTVPFFIGKRILQSDLYERLVETRAQVGTLAGEEWLPRPRFFPRYRA